MDLDEHAERMRDAGKVHAPGTLSPPVALCGETGPTPDGPLVMWADPAGVSCVRCLALVEHDRRLAAIEEWCDGESPVPPPGECDDPVLAACAALLGEFGVYYDPVLTPATVLRVVELVVEQAGADAIAVTATHLQCPSCGEAVPPDAARLAVFPCPNGVTGDDWRARDTDGCVDDYHHWGTGMHVVPVADPDARMGA